MEHKICLDTDFLVNFLRNKREEVDFIVNNENQIVFTTTFITLFELFYGAYKSNREENVNKVTELQSRLRLLNLSVEAVDTAGQIIAELERKGTPIEFRDLLIGCIAKTDGYPLKTYNKKHFERIPGLRLL